MPNIQFNSPYITGKEREYLEDVFSQDKFYGNGKYTQKCTQLISDRLCAQDVLLTDSCTSALEISALLLREWGNEQEIVLPSYTFSSTGAAFARCGFKLVFAEVDPKTLMLDPGDVRSRLSDKTAAVVVVHYGGLAAEIRELRSICDQQGIRLVEDAAQAFDCVLDGKALGTFGDFGCFSFHETKNLHAGLAGALLVNAREYSDRATHVWERGTNRQEVLKGLVDKYSWVEIGGSFYPTELQAAFLYAQLETVDSNREERRVIHEAYNEGLAELRDGEKLWFNRVPNELRTNYHAFFVLFDDEKTCDEVRQYLVQHKIAAYIGYVPLHSSPVGQAMGNAPSSLPITENSARRVLRLPLHNRMTSSDAARVCEVITEFFDEQ